MSDAYNYLLRFRDPINGERLEFKIGSDRQVCTSEAVRLKLDHGHPYNDSLVFIGAIGGPGSTEKHIVLHGTLIADSTPVWLNE
jgi:hypothetical protein